mmetsp:Transcript_2176/g.8452  ORF Transcript_2176/g.8452 Transcript_2176/m.8452 type:complete len:382 (-) Transcript_2176:548-1693(-)
MTRRRRCRLFQTFPNRTSGAGGSLASRRARCARALRGPRGVARRRHRLRPRGLSLRGFRVASPGSTSRPGVFGCVFGGSRIRRFPGRDAAGDERAAQPRELPQLSPLKVPGSLEPPRQRSELRAEPSPRAKASPRRRAREVRHVKRSRVRTCRLREFAAVRMSIRGPVTVCARVCFNAGWTPEPARQRTRHLAEEVRAPVDPVGSVSDGVGWTEGVRSTGPRRGACRRGQRSSRLPPLLQHLLLPRGAHDLRLELGHLAEAHVRDDVGVGHQGGDERTARLGELPRQAGGARESYALDVRKRVFAPVLLAENLRQQHRRPRAEAVTHDGQGVPRIGRLRRDEVVFARLHQPPRRRQKTRVRVSEHGRSVLADGVMRPGVCG